METMYLTHPACRLHEMGGRHPETQQSLDANADQLLSSGLMPFLVEHEAPAASREAILRVHTAGYLASLHARSPAEGYCAIDPDTMMNPHTYEAALHAAG